MIQELQAGVSRNDAKPSPDSDCIESTAGRSLWLENNSWVNPMLPTAKTSLYARRNLCMSCRVPQVVILRGEKARHAELPYSNYNSLIIDLPRAFSPALFSWPVAGVLTAIVCAGVYEKTLIDLCIEYKAPFVELYVQRNGEIELFDTYPLVDEALWEQDQ